MYHTFNVGTVKCVNIAKLRWRKHPDISIDSIQAYLVNEYNIVHNHIIKQVKAVSNLDRAPPSQL